MNTMQSLALIYADAVLEFCRAERELRNLEQLCDRWTPVIQHRQARERMEVAQAQLMIVARATVAEMPQLTD